MVSDPPELEGESRVKIGKAGVGYGMVVMTGIVAVYYNVIMAWSLFYFVMSFSPTLPWSDCGNDWNTASCYLRAASDNETLMTYNTSIGVNVTKGIGYVAANVTSQRRTPTEEYWDYAVLERTDGVENQGFVRWQLLLCLLGAWSVVFLCLIKGIKSSGKVMYVAAILPYILLLVLLVRGATLPGAWEGFKYYTVPKWDRLLSFSVWGDAAVQMFYSAGMGWGGISTLASYNPFHNDIQRDAILLPVLDCVTSWFAGCVIFVNLGYMAHSAGVHIDKVVSQGPGIAFMVYPEALSQLPLPQLWSVLFFLMLFTVGLDSQIVHVQTLTSALVDTFPRQLLKRKLLVTSGVCLTLFLLGISCITQGGIYNLQILDWYCASVAVMFIAFLEMVGLSWVYGVRRLYVDIELMVGRQLPSIWGVFWRFITPTIILLIWLFNLAQLTPVTYGDVSYPPWAIAIGWIVACVSIVPLPVFMIKELRRSNGSSFSEKLRLSIKPSPEWGPADKSCRQQYEAMLQNGTKTGGKELEMMG